MVSRLFDARAFSRLLTMPAMFLFTCREGQMMDGVLVLIWQRLLLCVLLLTEYTLRKTHTQQPQTALSCLGLDPHQPPSIYGRRHQPGSHCKLHTAHHLHLRLCFQPADRCIQSTSQLHVVQLLVLFADCVLCVDLSSLHIPLLNGFLNAKLLRLLLLLAFDLGGGAQEWVERRTGT